MSFIYIYKITANKKQPFYTYAHFLNSSSNFLFEKNKKQKKR